ncbi:MAG: glycosyltransferase, partial [Calditrichaceae bacterium]|nr:glycosyltransferase [Calditrichaceae bacterium]
DIDVIHFLEIEYFAFFIILPIIKFKKKPVVVLIHTGNFNFSSNNPILGLYKFISKYLVKTILNNVSIIIVHSDVIKKSLIDSLNLKIKNIHKIHITNYGTEPIVVMPNRQESLKILGLQRIKKKIVLFFGNVRMDKGIFELLKLNHFNRMDNYILLIAGKLTGIDKDKFYKLIEENSNIIFHEGFIDENKIKHYYNVAEYLILPYHNYFISASGPLTLSLTYRTPVICSQAKHIKNFVEKYNIGLSFDLYNENSFRDTIEYALKTEKENYYNNFDEAIIGNTWQDMVNSLIQIYNTLL